MYIAMQCADSNGMLNTEICTFQGIRYDTRYKPYIRENPSGGARGNDVVDDE